MLFCCLWINFFKKIFRNTMRVSDSLDPDQAQHFVQTVCRCYQQTTKVATSGERVKDLLFFFRNMLLARLRHRLRMSYSHHFLSIVHASVKYFKLFMPSGLFYHNSLRWSISSRRGVWLVLIVVCFYKNSCI